MLKALVAIAGGLALGLAQMSSAQDTPYRVVNVSNGGTISGVVKWTGPVPPLVTAEVTKDANICDPQSQKRVSLERLIIGPKGGVANSVVFLRNISSGKAFPTEESHPLLNQIHCRYSPHIVLVPQNSNLDIKSSDATLHTVHMEGAASYNLPFPFPDRISSRTMSSPGLVTLKCNGGHTWMNGEIWVIPNPYYAITDESGKFELTDVPPGEYELVAWHEGWKVQGREGTMDVLTQHRVDRPVFSEPKTWGKQVTVRPNSETAVEFAIANK